MRGLVVPLVAYAAGAAAFKLSFQNKCSYDIWPAVGLAPSGRPDNSFSWGTKASPGETVSVEVSNKALGVRAWGRTGCDGNGANCKTGACNGGMVCTDAGITSGVIVSEYGFGDFGQWGGERTSWDLSRVDLVVNIDTELIASDGQKVRCTKSNCPSEQAYALWDDYEADRNSAIGTGYTHVFCPNGSGAPASTPAFPGTQTSDKPSSAAPSSAAPSSPVAAPTSDKPADSEPSSTPTTGKKCPHIAARRLASLARRELYLASLAA